MGERVVVTVAVVLLLACRGEQAPAGQPAPGRDGRSAVGEVPPSDGSARAAERERMVREHIEARGVNDARTLGALRKLPVRFVPLVGGPGGETVPEPSQPRGSPSPRGP